MGKDLFLLSLFFLTIIFLYSKRYRKRFSIAVGVLEDGLVKIEQGLYLYRYADTDTDYRKYLQQTVSNLSAVEEAGIASTELDAMEAVMPYHEWLTREYNRHADRLFRRVRFRPLTIEDHVIAESASGMAGNDPYHSEIIEQTANNDSVEVSEKFYQLLMEVELA
ncbi:MAG TPA: hypothetical protein VFS31_18400 [Chitinophagaceae bacterium]|nr:hypothetical protein [Chitinophagaceae bacterium]